MFFAKYMFVTKGKLAKIWLAATYRISKRLQKRDIEKTNIEDSCQDIMAPLAPLALRVSGQLLVGVARIYQRKVEFLFLDCNDAVASMKVDVKDLKRIAVDLPPEAEGDVDSTLLSAAQQLGASSEFELIPALTLADMEKITDDVDMDQHMARGAEITLPDIDDLPRTPLSQGGRRRRQKAFQDDAKMGTMDDLLGIVDHMDLELPPSPQTTRSQRSARRSSLRNDDAASQLDPLNDPLNEIPQKDDDAKSTTSSHVSSPGKARGSRRTPGAMTPITPGIDDSTVDTPFNAKDAPDTDATKDGGRITNVPDMSDLMNDPLMEAPDAGVPFPPLEDGASVAADKDEEADKDQKDDDAKEVEDGKDGEEKDEDAAVGEQKLVDADEEEAQEPPKKKARRGRRGGGGGGSRATRMDKQTEISRSQMKRHLADSSDLLLDRRPRVSFKRRRRDEKYESARDIESLFKTPDFGEEMAPDIVRFYQLAQRAVAHQPAPDADADVEMPPPPPAAPDADEGHDDEKRDVVVDDAKSEVSGVTGVSSVMPPSDVDGDGAPSPFRIPHEPGFEEPGPGMLDDPGYIQLAGSQLRPDDVIDWVGPAPIRDDGEDGFFGASVGDKPLKTTSSGWSRRTRKMHQVLKNQGVEELELSSLIRGNKRMTVAGIFHELLVLKTNGYIDTIQEEPFGEIKIRVEHKMDAPLPDEEDEGDAPVANGAVMA